MNCFNCFWKPKSFRKRDWSLFIPLKIKTILHNNMEVHYTWLNLNDQHGRARINRRTSVY
uniref:Uncharacterized protein n=1 Tax=Octopus bimaculoides TaxID=37653 RepID=A0A0L8GHC6_OCTBM